MLPLLSLILPALVPVAADGLRSLVGSLFGGAGAKPQNVDEAVKLMGAETERMRALAELDRPAGEISRWVADLRASFRYIAAGVIVLGAPALTVLQGYGVAIPQGTLDVVWEMAGSVFSFMFGDRMYTYIKRGK